MMSKQPKPKSILFSLSLRAIVILSLSLGIAQIVLFPAYQAFLMGPLLRWEARYLNGSAISLLARQLAPLEAAAQYEQVNALAADFGYSIRLYDQSELDLSDVAMRQLENAEVAVELHDQGFWGDGDYSLYQRVADSRQVLAFLKVRTPADFYLSEGQRQNLGTFKVIQRHLAKLPPAQWQQAMAVLAKEFPHGVQLLDAEALPLMPAMKARLRSGDIVSIETEASAMANIPADTVYKRHGDYVIALGPFSDTELYNKVYLVAGVYYVLIGLMTLLPLALWLWPTWRSMNRLTDAANLLGKGDFRVRAATYKGGQFNHILHTFNHMADKIQSLVESNKSLVNAVSHELRTPISRIEFNLELARSREGQAKVDQLDRIECSVDDLKKLVDELLLYARFDTDKPNFQLSEIDIGEWLERELREWRLYKPDIAFELEQADEKLLAAVEPHYMSRAISNLVRNATRFAVAQVRVRIAKVNGALESAVADDGPGIPIEYRNQIFEPFARIETSRNRDLGGVGLGLAIVKQIVLWHNGKVWVETSEAGGARFVVQLPLCEGGLV